MPPAPPIGLQAKYARVLWASIFLAVMAVAVTADTVVRATIFNLLYGLVSSPLTSHIPLAVIANCVHAALIVFSELQAVASQLGFCIAQLSVRSALWTLSNITKACTRRFEMAAANVHRRVRCVRRTMRRRLYAAAVAFLKTNRFKVKVAVCKALAVVINYAKFDQNTADAHQIWLFGASGSPLVDSPAIDELFYSPLASPLTDVNGFCSLFTTPITDADDFCSAFATPFSDIDEYAHSPFVTPYTDVDEFYSPSAASLADVEEHYYSPSSTVDGSYCTPLSLASSSVMDGATPYFSPELHIVAQASVASSSIGLGIFVPASSTLESEDAEFLLFDTPPSSVTLWDEDGQDDLSILDFFGEPVLSDNETDKLAHLVEAADVPLPESPVELNDIADAVNIPLPDSPVDLVVAADIPLPKIPVECVNAADVPLPTSPVEVVDAAMIPLPDSPIEELIDAVGVPLPDSPIEVVDAADIPLPDSPIEVVDAAMIPLPDSPIEVVDAADIPLPDSPIEVVDTVDVLLPGSLTERVNAVDVPLPNSPFVQVDAAEIPLPDSPFEEVEVVVLPFPESLGYLELTEVALTSLPSSPSKSTDEVKSQFIVPRASPVLSVSSSESSPVLQFEIPASPSISCGQEAFDELAQRLASFSLQCDLPSVAPTTNGIIEEPVSVKDILPRASPALSAASSNSSPATRFTIPGSPNMLHSYTAFSYHMEDLIDFNLEKALIASPQVDTIIDAFASIAFEGPKGKKATDSTVALKVESQHKTPLSIGISDAPTTTDILAPPSLELTLKSTAVTPEILKPKELPAETRTDDKVQVNTEDLASTDGDNSKPQTFSTVVKAFGAPTAAAPLVSSAWTAMREPAAMVPDTPELGSSTPPSPDKRSLWTSIRETADILSATCSPVIGCSAPGLPFLREPSNAISLVAALRRLNVGNANEVSKETPMIVDDEDAGMYDKVTTPVSVWFGESEHTDEMEVDELPRSVHNAMDCDGDVDMISAPIRSDDGWATNVDMLDQDVDMTDLASRREAGRKPKAATVGPVPMDVDGLPARRAAPRLIITSGAQLAAWRARNAISSAPGSTPSPRTQSQRLPAEAAQSQAPANASRNIIARQNPGGQRQPVARPNQNTPVQPRLPNTQQTRPATPAGRQVAVPRAGVIPPSSVANRTAQTGHPGHPSQRRPVSATVGTPLVQGQRPANPATSTPAPQPRPLPRALVSATSSAQSHLPGSARVVLRGPQAQAAIARGGQQPRPHTQQLPARPQTQLPPRPQTPLQPRPQTQQQRPQAQQQRPQTQQQRPQAQQQRPQAQQQRPQAQQRPPQQTQQRPQGQQQPQQLARGSPLIQRIAPASAQPFLRRGPARNVSSPQTGTRP